MNLNPAFYQEIYGNLVTDINYAKGGTAVANLCYERKRYGVSGTSLSIDSGLHNKSRFCA